MIGIIKSLGKSWANEVTAALLGRRWPIEAPMSRHRRRAVAIRIIVGREVERLATVAERRGIGAAPTASELLAALAAHAGELKS
jgi:hypothetical protein